MSTTQTRPVASLPTTQPSSAVRINAKAAAVAGGAGDNICDMCDRIGLPILPLRYAVVPSDLIGQVSNPLDLYNLGEKFKTANTTSPMQAHRYALRTLREGYVMVYFGEEKWHAYVVNQGGYLRKLNDIDDPDFKTDRELSEACSRAGHNIPASFINIPAMSQKGGKRAIPTTLWIAFSDVLWTDTVREQYQGNGEQAATLREQRMQKFDTEGLSKQAHTVNDSFQLSQDKDACSYLLNDMVVEYAKSDEEAKDRTESKRTDIFSNNSSRYKWESAHPVSMRTAQAEALATHAAEYAIAVENTAKYMASAIVLNDPLGMVQELNASRLRQMETRQYYLSHDSISRPLLISQSIVGLKQLIEGQATAAVAAEEIAKSLPDQQTHTVISSWSGSGGVSYRIETDTRAERAGNKANSLWAELRDHYREADRAAFEKKVATKLKGLQAWQLKYDTDYAYWLAQPDWQCRDDFDPLVPYYQAQLIEAYAAALLGGPNGNDTSGPAVDSKVYDVWKIFLSKDPTDRHNPVYVALFGYQKEILDYLLPSKDDKDEETYRQNKGSKLYKAIKTIIGTKDLTSNTNRAFKEQGMKDLLTRDAADAVPNPVRVLGKRAMDRIRGGFVPKAAGAIAHTMLAIGGALSHMATVAISEVYRTTALRAFQAAMLLYEKREIYLVTTRIKLRDYLGYLNDIAFNAASKVSTATARGIRSVAKAGQNTVRSMAMAGELYISNREVKDSLINVLSWAYDDLGSITSAMDTVQSKVQTAKAANVVAKADCAKTSAAMAAAMEVHPFTLSSRAKGFIEKINSKAQTLGMGSANVLKSVARGSLRTASTGSGVLAVGSLFMQAWSLKDNFEKADDTFAASNEARMLLIASGTATLGAAAELGSLGAKLAEVSWSKTAGIVGRCGGVLGAIGSIVEGIQAFMSADRVGARGDTDAKWLYRLAGACLIAGGVVGVYAAATSASLFGPVGWALALVIVGVGFLYLAAKAEDSQAAIWLDRCYWGNGSRYANAQNPLDKPWTDKEINDELSQLNAIIIGLSGEASFNDDGWGVSDNVWDTVKAKLTFPNYSEVDSAYEWQLRAVNVKGYDSVLLASGTLNALPPDSNTVYVKGYAKRQDKPRPKKPQDYFYHNVSGPNYRLEGPNKDVLVMEYSAKVRVDFIQDIELTVDYAPDLADPHGRAFFHLSKSD
jgi:hypothetical protein